MLAQGNGGRLIYDRLGNLVKLPDGRRFTPRQDLPLELGQARGLGETEHVSILSIIKHKTAKV